MHSCAFRRSGVLKFGGLFSCLIGCGSVTSSKPDTGRDAAIDAIPDAGPDATDATSALYDIAYIYEFTINPDTTGVSAFLLVINRGTAPLALSTARVAFVNVDSG